MSFYKQHPHNTTLLLFSCPGRREYDEGKPCAGATGENLKELLKELNRLNPREFPKEREHYYINNAWDRFEYEEITGRTEATADDLLSKRNIKRLAAELAHVEKIICFGDKAKLVVKELLKREYLKPGIAIHHGPHLGFQSINRRVKTDIDGNQLKKGRA